MIEVTKASDKDGYRKTAELITNVTCRQSFTQASMSCLQRTNSATIFTIISLSCILSLVFQSKNVIIVKDLEMLSVVTEVLYTFTAIMQSSANYSGINKNYQ